MSLSKVEKGKRTVITGMNVGSALLGRLASMGLVPGAEVEMVNNSLHNGYIIRCKDTRLVLGRGLAHIIQVQD
ncbi:MAG: FeoA family protein [Planctomycetia bacterium]|nr:FeoA family protein [Planctomycetia bacterium]